MSDNLEDLDNKSLREKCLDYGLPNVPITDTSRNIIIKRLRKVIANGAKPAEKTPVSQKTRRDTVHVIKIQTEEPEKDDAEKQKSRNRRTIGTPRVMLERMDYQHEEKKDVPEKNDAPGKKTTNVKANNANTPAMVTQSEEPKTPQRRRSTRASSTPQPPSVVDAQQNKKKYDELLEEDEEDFAQIAPTLERSSSRMSRGSSLSTSPIVTTSYVNQPAASLIDLDDDDDSESEPDVIHVGVPPRSQPMMEAGPSYNPFKSYEAAKPPSTNSTYSMRYSTGGVRQSPMRTSALERTTTSKHSYEPGVTRRQTTVTSSRPAPVSEYIKSLTQSSEDKENFDDLDLEERSPYLSRFAQRISRLQAEPLRSSIGSPLRASNLDSGRFRSPPITARKRISENESVRESFYKFIGALDEKYNLKGAAILAAFLSLVLFIYLMFF